MAATRRIDRRPLGPESPVASVEQYLEAMNAQDWASLAETISPISLFRDGPFIDVIEGKDAYVKFLEDIISTLPNYELRVRRISATGDDRFYVELSESFDVGSDRAEYPEICLFETGADGLISYVSVFMKRPGEEGPVEGANASTRSAAG